MNHTFHIWSYTTKRRRMCSGPVTWAFWFLWGPLLSGCVSSPISVPPSTTKPVSVDYPVAGVSTTALIGERMAARGVQTTVAALRITGATQFNKTEGESSTWTCALTVQPGVIYERGRYHADGTNDECFGPVGATTTLSDGNTNFNCPGQSFDADICRKIDGSLYIASGPFKFSQKQDLDKIIYSPVEVISGNSNLVQELIFNGKNANDLKVAYREFTDSATRPSYVQDTVLTVGEDSRVAFKGLLIQIVEFSNAKITYKVISNFSPVASQ